MKNIIILFAVIMAFCFGTVTIVLAWWSGGEDCDYYTFWQGNIQCTTSDCNKGRNCGTLWYQYDCFSSWFDHGCFGMLAPRRVGQSSETSKQPDNKA